MVALVTATRTWSARSCLVVSVLLKLTPSPIPGLTMDAWEPYAVREHCRDAVRAWAELEAKSPQMAADLAQQRDELEPHCVDWRLMLTLGVRIAAWVVESWWQITRR